MDESRPVTDITDIIWDFSNFLIHNLNSDLEKRNPDSLFLVRQEWVRLLSSYVSFHLSTFDKKMQKCSKVTYKKGEE